MIEKMSTHVREGKGQYLTDGLVVEPDPLTVSESKWSGEGEDTFCNY